MCDSAAIGKHGQGLRKVEGLVTFTVVGVRISLLEAVPSGLVDEFRNGSYRDVSAAT
jgi:hypothetical protein